jgi:hypothetical protein
MKIDETWPSFGDPTFIFKVEQLKNAETETTAAAAGESDGNKEKEEVLRTYYKTLTLSSEQNEREAEAILNVDQGYRYRITEAKAGRYKLTGIEAVTSNVTPEKLSSGDKYAIADLTNGNNFAEVRFNNSLNQYAKLYHAVNATNIVKTGVKLTGIRVVYSGPPIIEKSTEGYDPDTNSYKIPDTDLTVTAMYDDGTSAILEREQYIWDNDTVNGNSSGYIGVITYTEGGITCADSFTVDVSSEMLKEYTVTVVYGGDLTNQVYKVMGSSKFDEPEVPDRPGYRFEGWYKIPQDDEDEKNNSNQYKFDFKVPIKADTYIYAHWTEDFDIQYCVAIYEINDVDDDGTVLPLTFGPATFASSPFSSTDAKKYYIRWSGHGDGELCLHDMTWEEIIDQAYVDPTAFEDCMIHGCTHSVKLNVKDSDGEYKKFINAENELNMAITRTGDGVSVLSASIDPEYRYWNKNHSETYIDHPEAGQYSGGTTAGGWPDSKIRNTLNGTTTANMLNVTNRNNDAEFLDESTALISCFPEVLQNAIYPRTIKSEIILDDPTSTDGKWTVANSRDKLWLLSPNEFYKNVDEFGNGASKTYTHPLEGETFERQTVLDLDDRASTSETGVYLDSSSKAVNAYMMSDLGNSEELWSRSIANSQTVIAIETNGTGGGLFAFPPIGNQGPAGLSPCFSLRY